MTDSAETRIEAGRRIRTEVLGAAHVARSVASADEFSLPIQELVMEYCWGAIWSRPGLERRDRSLINIGMLVALGKTHELGVHIRGALNNGLTVEQIREALLQTAVYCGVPAGLEAFRVAKAVLDDRAGA
jgi:4-carboxymuconolactone decarboxylase